MKRKQAILCAVSVILLFLIGKGIGEFGKAFLSSEYREEINWSFSEWFVKEQCNLIQPRFFYNEKKESSLREVIHHLFPGYQYIDDHGTSQKLVLSEQSIPNTFLEDGGEEETTLDTETEAITTEQPATTEAATEAVVAQEPSPGVLPYSMEQLCNPDFLRSQIYSIDSATTVLDSELNAKKYLDMDFSLNKQNDAPQILIYHTHTSEEFRKGKHGEDGNTVVQVGDYLTKLLTETYGYSVYHDTTVYDVINGVLDRNKAYTQSANGVAKLLKQYPSVEVVIDLHRDGVAEKTKLVTTVNGKKTAQIMLFNGMSRTASNGEIAYLKNPNREANLGFTFQLQMAAAKEFPGFTRKIFVRGYRYNLQFRPRCLLVEVGAQNNTISQAKNAMEPLAKILNEVLE